MSGAGGGFAGTVGGSLFGLPGWVDTAKTPGTTPQAVPPWSAWARSVLTGKALLWSPNFIWLSFAVAVYVVFPYDFGAARTLAPRWVASRLAINTALLFGYFGFWEVTLYSWDWSKRKFKGSWVSKEGAATWVNNNWPTRERLGHNCWWCLLAAVQYTCWEVFVVHLYATGKLPHIKDEAAFASWQNALRMVLWTAAVPVWRGAHFYFAHRFIHMRFLYKFVHSLHHRNTDIEPFSGLAMHPIEHLYYFSCIAPSLYFNMSPFHFTWNMVHLLLSPAASHSGWEDHTQSDQFHYLHHAKFECNYGSASFPLDNYFGTFREKLGDSQLYKGADEAEAVDDTQKPGGQQAGAAAGKGAASKLPTEPPPRTWEGLNTKSPRGFGAYMLFTALLFSLFLAQVACDEQLTSGGMGLAAVCDSKAQRFVDAKLAQGALLLGTDRSAVLAGCLAFGPLLFGALLMLATRERITQDKSLRYPFHKEPVVGQFGFHLLAGLLAAVLPVYHVALPLLRPDVGKALQGCTLIGVDCGPGAWDPVARDWLVGATASNATRGEL